MCTVENWSVSYLTTELAGTRGPVGVNTFIFVNSWNRRSPILLVYRWVNQTSGQNKLAIPKQHRWTKKILGNSSINCIQSLLLSLLYPSFGPVGLYIVLSQLFCTGKVEWVILFKGCLTVVKVTLLLLKNPSHCVVFIWISGALSKFTRYLLNWFWFPAYCSDIVVGDYNKKLTGKSMLICPMAE